MFLKNGKKQGGVWSEVILAHDFGLSESFLFKLSALKKAFLSCSLGACLRWINTGITFKQIPKSH